ARPVVFTTEPAGFAMLKKATDPPVIERIKKLDALITWPGQPGYVAPPVAQPLTAEEKKQFELGKSFYEASCIACHQPTGEGQEGWAPPLVNSAWVLGS